MPTDPRNALVARSPLAVDFARLGEEVRDLIAAGAELITFHAEAAARSDRTLQFIRAAGCKVGLVDATRTDAQTAGLPGEP